MKSDRDIYRFLAGVELIASVMATSQFVMIFMFCCFVAMLILYNEDERIFHDNNL